MAITDKSGTAGLLMWLRQHRSELAAGLSKQDDRLRRLNRAVMDQYSAGRVTSLSDEEVDHLVGATFGVHRPQRRDTTAVE